MIICINPFMGTSLIYRGTSLMGLVGLTWRKHARFKDRPRVDITEYTSVYDHIPRVRRDAALLFSVYRGTSLIRNCNPLGPYRRTMPMALWWSQGGAALSYVRGIPVHRVRRDAALLFSVFFLSP